jgi:hypothetical protein
MILLDHSIRPDREAGSKRRFIMTDYGTVNFNGKTLTLTQGAYCDNYGTQGNVRYYASAVDADGNKYIVAWDTTEQWQQWQKEYANHDNDYDYIAGLEDESNACDWDNPIEVRSAILF